MVGLAPGRQLKPEIVRGVPASAFLRPREGEGWVLAGVGWLVGWTAPLGAPAPPCGLTLPALCPPPGLPPACDSGAGIHRMPLALALCGIVTGCCGAGIHRVQRVPVTESGGRVHTSAASVAVLPQAEDVDVHIRQVGWALACHGIVRRRQPQQRRAAAADCTILGRPPANDTSKRCGTPITLETTI